MRLQDPQRPALSIEVDEAKSRRARMKGLLGVDSLPSGRGLLLRGRQVHTFGMRFAIDAVYLSGAGEVVRVVSLAPGRLGPFVPAARSVLELASGEAERLDLKRGDRLTKDPSL